MTLRHKEKNDLNDYCFSSCKAFDTSWFNHILEDDRSRIFFFVTLSHSLPCRQGKGEPACPPAGGRRQGLGYPRSSEINLINIRSMSMI